LGGGINEVSASSQSGIIGGVCNRIYNTIGSVILGGCNNYITGSGQSLGDSAIIGGRTNSIYKGNFSATIGGVSNIVTGSYNFLGPGKGPNLVSGSQSFIGSGQVQAVCANNAGIVGGQYNTVNHNNSFIVGSCITTQADCTTFVNSLAYYAYGNATTYLANNSAAGEIIYAGNTSTDAGKIYFLTGSAGTPSWTAANAQSANTSTNLLAMAVGSNSNTDGMLIRGFARYTADFTFTTGRPGDPLYLSDSTFLNGVMLLTPPASSGDIVRIMGYIIDATDELMYFDPDKSWVEIA
jgi:hypothetical protein